jgi:hypothetical protein
VYFGVLGAFRQNFRIKRSKQNVMEIMMANLYKVYSRNNIIRLINAIAVKIQCKNLALRMEKAVRKSRLAATSQNTCRRRNTVTSAVLHDVVSNKLIKYYKQNESLYDYKS